MRRSFWFTPVLATICGLVVLVASAGGWVAAEEARTIGGVVVTEPVSVSGTRFAPTAVAFGLAGLLGGVAAGVARGRARRILGTALLAIAGGALLAIGIGVSRAAAADGTLTAAPFVAVVGALGIGLAGATAVAGAVRPPAASPYRVASERSGDEEWTLASGEDS